MCMTSTCIGVRGEAMEVMGETKELGGKGRVLLKIAHMTGEAGKTTFLGLGRDRVARAATVKMKGKNHACWDGQAVPHCKERSLSPSGGVLQAGFPWRTGRLPKETSEALSLIWLRRVGAHKKNREGVFGDKG